MKSYTKVLGLEFWMEDEFFFDGDEEETEPVFNRPGL